MKSAPRGETHFQDTLERVPHLLESCVPGCIDVKVLRLVCKSASTAALQAIRTYCLQLPLEPSQTEPLQEVAGLLQCTRLRHLRLELSVPDKHSCSQRAAYALPSPHLLLPPPVHTPPPKSPLHTAQPTSPESPHELASHIARLQDFFFVMALSLTTVTSVEITVSLSKNSKQWTPYTFPGHLSTEAGNEFALLLTASCPAVRRIELAGGLGQSAMHELGTRWPELKILDIPRGGSSMKLFGRAHGHVLLPSITHMRINDSQQSGFQGDFKFLSLYTSLTHLEVGIGWLGKESSWLGLPKRLRMLRCGELPLRMPPLLRLDCLETIQITDTREHSTGVETSVLASLLRAAPALQLLMTLHSVWNTIHVSHCDASVIDDTWLVSQRIAAGLRLEGVAPPASRYVEVLESDQILSAPRRRRPSRLFPNNLEPDLSRPPRVYTIDTCDFRPWRHAVHWTDYLGPLACAFPYLKTLRLGSLMDPSTMNGSGQSSSFTGPLAFQFANLRSLVFKNARPTCFVVLQLVASMPQLTHLRVLDTIKDSKLKGDEAFRLRLVATQAVAAAADPLEESNFASGLGDWTLVSTSLDDLEWNRSALEDGLPIQLALSIPTSSVGLSSVTIS